MASEKASQITADDLEPLVAKLSPEEQVRLAYYALRIARSVDSSAGEGLPDMAEFHKRLKAPSYAGNTVIEMRDEEDR